MGYLCSSRNVEGFYNFNLIDNTPSANRGNVKSKDDGSFWKYMGGVTIIESGMSDYNNTNSLKINFNDGNGQSNLQGIIKLFTGFGVSESLPFIWQFYDGNSGKAFVIRTIQGWFSRDTKTLTLVASRSNGIVDQDFNQLKEIKSVMQLRIGVFDVNNGSQRQHIESKWDN
jgi:hypothetical protein